MKIWLDTKGLHASIFGKNVIVCDCKSSVLLEIHTKSLKNGYRIYHKHKLSEKQIDTALFDELVFDMMGRLWCNDLQ